MAPTRQTVVHDHVAAAPGSFATLDLKRIHIVKTFERSDMGRAYVETWEKSAER